jgi:hypothetical protein
VAEDLVDYATDVLLPSSGEDPLAPRIRVLQIGLWVAFGLAFVFRRYIHRSRLSK